MNTFQHQFAQADMRRAQLMQEAEAHRLSQASDQPALTDRLLTSVGEWMVTEGTRLKSRQKLPVTSSRLHIGSAEG